MTREQKPPRAGRAVIIGPRMDLGGAKMTYLDPVGVSQHSGKRNGCWATVPDQNRLAWPTKCCEIDAREGYLTCIKHADREERARELEREIQRMVDDEEFIATDAKSVMGYRKPR
jgi:hypothetical protein